MDIGLSEIADIIGAVMVFGAIAYFLFSPEANHIYQLISIYVDNFNGKV